MTGDPRMFTSLDEEVDGQERITFGDNSKGKVKGSGKVAISNDHSISNVLYVASLSFNLLFEVKLKKIRSDNGKEFDNTNIKAYCDEVGIKHEVSATYTPQ